VFSWSRLVELAELMTRNQSSVHRQTTRDCAYLFMDVLFWALLMALLIVMDLVEISDHLIFEASYLVLWWLLLRSGNGVGYINKVKLRWPRLVLGLVTTFRGSTIPVFSRPRRPTQPVCQCNEYWRWFWPPLGKKRRVLRSSGPYHQDCWHTAFSQSLAGWEILKGMSSLVTDVNLRRSTRSRLLLIYSGVSPVKFNVVQTGSCRHITTYPVI